MNYYDLAWAIKDYASFVEDHNWDKAAELYSNICGELYKIFNMSIDAA